MTANRTGFGNTKKLRLTAEIILAVTAVILAVYIIRKYAPEMLALLKDGNIDELAAYLNQEGRKGRTLLILLQIIETVAIFIPAAPVYISAGIVFGGLQGFLMCYITNLVMNIIIFAAARKFRATTRQFVDVSKNPKLENLMMRAKYPGYVVIGMCLLPIVPNGMIPYVSAQTEITFASFAGTLALGSLPSIFLYTCSGYLLMNWNTGIMAPVIILLVILTVGVLVNRARITTWIDSKIKKVNEI